MGYSEPPILQGISKHRLRRTLAEENEFLRLIDSVQPPLSAGMIEALLSTFCGIEDDGTQETVIGKLLLAPPELYIPALLDQLPRLIREAPEWALDLLYRSEQKSPAELLSGATRLNRAERRRLAEELKPLAEECGLRFPYLNSDVC